jgi:hypothetical protein
LLPDTDHVVRTCKKSSLDAGRPTPASFEFRVVNDEWHDTYLSVNWLEYLHQQTGELVEKLERLRAFQLANEHGLQIVKPTRSNVFAVLPTAVVQSVHLKEVGTTLECRHEPNGELDPHSGIYPSPGVEHWPANGDAPAHLAVQQFLFQSICHWEPGILPAPQGHGNLP